MNNEITSTQQMVEESWDGSGEVDNGYHVQSEIVATKKAEGKGIEFHVSMRDYTQKDMEDLIVEAAARILVGEYGSNELGKLIEQRCVTLVTQKADAHLATVTKEIIEQPVIPNFRNYKGDQPPVTMREFIGLVGREYLTERVGIDGNPTKDTWGTARPRIQHLAEVYLARAFKAEIEKATNAAISEIQKAVRAQHDALLAAEKARVREAIAKVTA